MLNSFITLLAVNFKPITNQFNDVFIQILLLGTLKIQWKWKVFYYLYNLGFLYPKFKALPYTFLTTFNSHVCEVRYAIVLNDVSSYLVSHLPVLKQYVVTIVSYTTFNTLSSLNIGLVVTILLFSCILKFNGSNSRYSFIKSIMILFICLFVTLTQFNLIFWIFFILITELTGIYLISIVFINIACLKIKQSYLYVTPLLGLLYFTQTRLYYSWFDTYIPVFTKLINTEFLKMTLMSSNILTVLFMLLWLLSVLLIINLFEVVLTKNNANIVDFITKLRIIINSTNESLNLFLKANLSKWGK